LQGRPPRKASRGRHDERPIEERDRGAGRRVRVGPRPGWLAPDGFTIAVSEARLVTPIARRTILGEDALSVLVSVLEDVAGFDRARVRAFFEAQGLSIREWDRVRTDRLSIGGPAEDAGAVASA
jgi:hypothetical protein